ncbi:hypothetical protein [Bacillus bombysepticus]|uniref:hypothetical protein n=1 Tax=Bacillus bombysepticus TaxID=658666 RepID=UPI00301819F4
MSKTQRIRYFVVTHGDLIGWIYIKRAEDKEDNTDITLYSELDSSTKSFGKLFVQEVTIEEYERVYNHFDQDTRALEACLLVETYKGTDINLEIGKQLYLDWEEVKFEAHAMISLLKERIDISTLKKGFIEERSRHIVETFNGEHAACFYGALEEAFLLETWGPHIKQVELYI